MNKLTQYIVAAVAAIVMLIAALSTAHAGEAMTTGTGECATYKMDIYAEMMRRGYRFDLQYTCTDEPQKKASHKFTIIMNGVKEVIYCNPIECK